MTDVIVAPSLLSCDFAAIGDEVRALEQAGADWLHVDVMDGHFVPNLTIGPVVVAAIRRVASIPLDVHLMIAEPGRYVSQFAKAGADWLTVHAETAESEAALSALLAQIRAAGCKVGLTVSPPTPVERLLPHLGEIDLALIMTVNPGFAGQAFIPAALDKVRRVREEARSQSLDLRIEVDGGINATTAAESLHAGADVIVAGNYVFSAPGRDYASRIRSIRDAVASVPPGR